MSKNVKIQSTYKKLIWKIQEVMYTARNIVITTVNTTLVETYWYIWKQIVEYEQNWKEKAKYWTKLLKQMAKDLTKELWKGFSERNLELMRKLYITFPKLMDSWISQSLIAKLSWTHLVRLLGVKGEIERNFYLVETTENNWSVRELDRQINSWLYERLSLSKDKKWVISLSKKWQLIEKSEDIIKDPYILEFLWIEEKSIYSESDLENAIINNLEHFLLELWKGYTFVARQNRLTNWPDHYYIDLVFYNRLLKCFVLIDLKIGKLKHKDIWQMQMYVNYYDKNIKIKNENPTVWLVLCKENDEFVVEYTIPQWNKQIYAKEYKLYLPKKEELKKELSKYLK